MNRTIRNLVIAVPLATVGLTMVNTGAAVAGPGPVIIIQPNEGDPEPKPDFPIKDAPKPKGPQDKAPLPKDNGPQDKAPKPAAKPQPQAGNQVVAAPAAAKAVKAPKKVVAAEVLSLMVSPDSVDRIGAELVAGPAQAALEVAESDNGMDLTWLLVGGGIVTASGIAFAARKRANA